MAKHVFSTLSADTWYTDTERGPGGLNRVKRSVLVRGGAGVALRGAGQKVITPGGIRTEVSDEDAEFLASHGIFKEQMKNGFVSIENTARDPETVAQKMNNDDPSRPKTPADVKKSAEEAAAKASDLAPDETLSVATNSKKK